MPSNRRTIVVPDDAWERWKDAAWRSRISVSEYIRRAVDAYAGGGNASNGGPHQLTWTSIQKASAWHSPSGFACGLKDLQEVAGLQPPADGVGYDKSELFQPEIVDSLHRAPFTKERQTGRGGKNGDG